MKDKIRKILGRYKPLWYYMPVQTGYGVQGVPDFIICANGRFFAIEAKAGKGTTTKLQDIALDDINRAEGHAIVISDMTVDQDVIEAHLRMLGCVLK